MATTECPLCGYTVSKKGIGSHKGSKRCKVQQDKSKIRENDLVAVQSSRMREFIEENDWYLEKLRYKYDNSGRFNRGSVEIRRRWYTTEDTYEKARDNILPNPQDNGVRGKVDVRPEDGAVVRIVSRDEMVYVPEFPSRRRVCYIDFDRKIAYTHDGDSIGDVYFADEAAEEFDVDSELVISAI